MGLGLGLGFRRALHLQRRLLVVLQRGQGSRVVEDGLLVEAGAIEEESAREVGLEATARRVRAHAQCLVVVLDRGLVRARARARARVRVRVKVRVRVRVRVMVRVRVRVRVG